MSNYSNSKQKGVGRGTTEKNDKEEVKQKNDSWPSAMLL